MCARTYVPVWMEQLNGTEKSNKSSQFRADSSWEAFSGSSPPTLCFPAEFTHQKNPKPFYFLFTVTVQFKLLVSHYPTKGFQMCLSSDSE